MRHRKSGLKLSKSISHRQAIFKNMVTSLFKHDRIRTTDVKAKELRRWADHVITLAKQGDLHARRQVLAIIKEKDVVHRIFEEVVAKFGSRKGGYTRIVKIGHRAGDAAPVSLVELIGAGKAPAKKTGAKKEKAPSVAKAEAEKQPIAAPVAEKDMPAVGKDQKSVMDAGQQQTPAAKEAKSSEGLNDQPDQTPGAVETGAGPESQKKDSDPK
jgi:large subunit ribosomal protein L17